MLLISCYCIKQKIHAIHFSSLLKDKKKTTVTVSSKKLIWVEDEKEAIVDGKLFDVYKYSINKDSITIQGIFDTIEDEIAAEIEHLQQQKTNNKNIIVTALGKIFNTTVPNYTLLKKQPIIALLNTKFFPWHLPHYCNYIATVNTPPPNYLVSI